MTNLRSSILRILLTVLVSIVLGCDSDPGTETANEDPKPDTKDSLVAPLYGQSSILITPDGDTLRNEGLNTNALVLKVDNMSDTRQLDFSTRDNDKDMTLSIYSAVKPGRYPIDSLTYNVYLRIGSKTFHAANGWLDITLMDFEKHEITATFSVRFRESKNATEEFTVTGVVNRADLTTQDHDTEPASTVDDNPVYSRSCTESVNLKLLDLYALGAGLEGTCRGKSIYVSRTFTIRLKEPKLGVFRQEGQTRWNDQIEEAPNDPECEDIKITRNALATDSLVVTEYDPVARHIAGWLTIEGKRSDFIFTCWTKRYWL